MPGTGKKPRKNAYNNWIIHLPIDSNLTSYFRRRANDDANSDKLPQAKLTKT
jgi:hypothetical protein